ncbi:MAG: hypothetical protein J6C55_00560 [Oscillospiraceae bacterium]|nr:hypothetical protein [Oscillospiraceae bacterium]
MYKKIFENNFYKIVLFTALISSCFIGCYKKDDDTNLSFGDEIIGDTDTNNNSLEEKNVRYCSVCGDKLKEEDIDVCKPCQEVNNIISSSEETQETQNEEYLRSYSPSLSDTEEK